MSRSWPLVAGSAPVFTSGVLLHRGWEQRRHAGIADGRPHKWCRPQVVPPVCRHGRQACRALPMVLCCAPLPSERAAVPLLEGCQAGTSMQRHVAREAVASHPPDQQGAHQAGIAVRHQVDRGAVPAGGRRQAAGVWVACQPLEPLALPHRQPACHAGTPGMPARASHGLAAATHAPHAQSPPASCNHPPTAARSTKKAAAAHALHASCSRLQ